MPQKPEILNTETVARSQLFEIEQVSLQFSNGEQRIFERLISRRPPAVMIVPLLDANTVLLVREYAVGVDRYDMSFPKGLLEVDEEVAVAANRELREETGYGARKLEALKELSSAPGYMANRMYLYLATDLYESPLEGDEPEEIEVVPWSLDNLDELLARDDFSESRSVAALYMVKEKLKLGE